MNMLSTIVRANDDQTLRDEAGGWFLDEKGNPSDRCGPDLKKAEPIDDVIARLRRLRNGFAVALYSACRASGIDVSAVVWANGEERLLMGYPLDSQQDLRKERFEKLEALVHSTTRRRKAVLDLVNFLGHFADNRPFASVEEAAEKYLAAGGRIYVLADGRCEETLPYRDEEVMKEGWNGYPLRRMFHRYEATLRARGARAEMARLVKLRGVKHEGSGAYVLDTSGRNMTPHV